MDEWTTILPEKGMGQVESAWLKRVNMSARTSTDNHPFIFPAEN